MHRFLRWARFAVVVGAAVTLAPAARAYPDTYEGRLQALALVQSLNADLLSRPSASETLHLWCARRHIADPAEIKATMLPVSARPITPRIRALLGAGTRDEVRYRHVQLTCGGKVLSEADNWYLPSRLTAAMNHALDSSDAPFGVVVRPLNFTRRTLNVSVLFHTFAGDDAKVRADPGPRRLLVPPYVLQHIAVLSTGDGVPFSVVVETYTRALIDRPDQP